MVVVRYKNQTEYAFLCWIGSYPESFHPLDMQRFYTFAKCVARYRSQKWKNFNHFRDAILKHKPHFDPENIDRFYDLLIKLVEFHGTPAIESVGMRKGGHGYKQVGVKNGEIYEINITEAEYMSGGKRL